MDRARKVDIRWIRDVMDDGDHAIKYQRKKGKAPWKGLERADPLIFIVAGVMFLKFGLSARSGFSFIPVYSDIFVVLSF